MKPLVLLIDDNEWPTQMYILALEQAGLAVKHCRTTDEALQEAETIVPSALVVDVMMPSGNCFREQDTEEGLKTGLFLYEALRKRFPKVPVFIFTNVSDPNLLSLFQEGPLLHVLSKDDCTPNPFAAIVRQTLQKLGPKPGGA